MKTIKLSALILFLTVTSFSYSTAQVVNAPAPEKTASPLKFLINGALELGGDEVAEVYFTNGNTQSVNAGQGISFGVGGQLQIPKVEKLLLRGTIGYKYVTTAADNAHIRLTRVPIHLTANFMATPKLRLSAGLASHRGIRFEADEIGQDVTFKPASGPIFEIAYHGIGLSYTAMKYQDQDNISYAANAIGLTFSIALPR